MMCLLVLLIVLGIMALSQVEGYLVTLKNEAGSVLFAVKIEQWQQAPIFLGKAE